MFKICGNYSGQLRPNMRKALILLAFFVVENFVLITKIKILLTDFCHSMGKLEQKATFPRILWKSENLTNFFKNRKNSPFWHKSDIMLKNSITSPHFVLKNNTAFPQLKILKKVNKINTLAYFSTFSTTPIIYYNYYFIYLFHSFRYFYRAREKFILYFFSFWHKTVAHWNEKFDIIRLKGDALWYIWTSARVRVLEKRIL